MGDDIDKAKRDDKAKGVDGALDRASKPKQADEAEDKLGAMAKSETASADGRDIENSLEVVTQSFHWFNEAAQAKIEGLRRHLKQEDEPDWATQLAQAVLEVALGAGAAAAGARLAEKFVPAAGEVGTEFVKMMWEGGINAGVTAGRAKLGGGHDDNVVDPFIDSQKEGVAGAQMRNQTQFIKVGRDQVKTVAEARKLEAAHSEGSVRAAAEEQYEATRDAWVSYLAQTKFGAIGKRGAVTKGQVNVGPTTTNMSTQERRDRTNKSAPNFVPGDAPDFGDAMHGDAPGVLEVVAELPKISNDKMDGKPSVELAYLNGVNGTIRKQYEGVPLAAMKIPRQVVAEVDGAPDFTINLNEQGDTNYLKPKQRTWLAARATVDHPENASKDEWQRYNEGLRLLLEELVPQSIKKTFW